MKEQIKNYLDLVNCEIKKSYTDEINFEQAAFEYYSVFDFVNFHIVYQYILNDKTKQDFFISIPEDDYRDNFFNSIFQSLVYIKLYQNYFQYEKTIPLIVQGDLVYSKLRKRVFKVLGKGPSEVKVEYRFPKGNEKGNNFTIKGHKFTKINPDLSNGRNTGNNIDNYTRFLDETFGSKFPFLTEFTNRTLVIADQKFFKESKHLPIRYTNKNGKIKNDLPFFNYMIECCNDFQTAKNHLLNTNQYFDEIIIIADSKYKEKFDSILQETKYRGKVKNIILIGTEKPSSQNDFIEWLWSSDEVKIGHSEISTCIKKICLQDGNLFNKLVELKKQIDEIKEENDVNLSFLLKYTNFFFRLLLINTPISKGVFTEYLDRLTIYFKSEKFEEELNNLFYDKDIYNSEEIKNHTDRVFAVFSELSKELQTKNLKWNYIKEKAKIRQVFLLVEKKAFDAVQVQLRNEKIHNVKVISDKRIDGNKDYLDKWLNSQRNSENKLVIIPYLNDVGLYKKLKAIKGECEVLCYENIDEISFDNLTSYFENDEIKRLSHRDRLLFFKTDFKFSNEIKKRELDDLFHFDLDKNEFKENYNDLIDLPKEKAFYEVHFSDGTKDKFDSSKGVFLIEDNEQIKTTIGEIYINAKIRFYQNTNPTEFKKVLKILDKDNLLTSFDSYSESWKKTLNKLRIKYGNIENLYHKLFTKENKINYNTFRLYFENDSQTRFPRNKVLEAIKNLCASNEFAHELIVLDFTKFKIYSSKDSSIKQQAGRILGNDLLDYIASNKTETSDPLKKLSEETLEKLTETIQEKTVIKKILLDDE